MLRGTQTLFALARRVTLNTRSNQAQNLRPSFVDRVPTELLHGVFELLARNTLATCMRVCRRWYDIASHHFLAVVPVTHRHCKRFLKYLRTNPRLAENITALRFFDKSCGDSGKVLGMPRGPFDIQLLVSALPFLANLRILFLVGYDHLVCDQSSLSILQKQYQNAPISLQRLYFEHCSNVVSMLPEILPFFSVNTLAIDVHLPGPMHYLETTVHDRAPVPSASIPVQNLLIGGDARYEEDNYAVFESVLASGGLRGLGTRRWTKRDIPILERFLRSSAVRDLVSISIGAVFGEYTYPEQADATANNGEPTVCEMLGAALAHCPRLQYIQLGFVHRGHARSDPLAANDPFSPILANLPATLRAFALHIWLDTPGLWCCTSTTIGLDAVDRTLAPPSPSAGGWKGGRFPNLRRVELHVHQNLVSARMRENTCTYPREERELMPLPRLRAAGLLQYYVCDVDNDQPHADLYWPLDMGLVRR